MFTRYCDTGSVVEALDHHASEITHEDDSRLVLRVIEAPVVMRGITREAVARRNCDRFMTDEVCTLEYDGTQLKLGFHQDQVEGSFELIPAGPRSMGADQMTDLSAFAPAVGDVVGDVIDATHAFSADFVEVAAGSYASGGHLTDFEFEYILTGF